MDTAGTSCGMAMVMLDGNGAMANGNKAVTGSNGATPNGDTGSQVGIAPFVLPEPSPQAMESIVSMAIQLHRP